jgi:hypothetical protein
MSTKKLLEEEIQSEIEEISKMEVGSDKHKAATEALAKLMDKYNEMDKLELEYQDKYDSREADRIMKEKQLEHDKKDAKVKNSLTAVSVGGGLLVTIWGICKSLKFEETGIYSSLISRGMIQKILPKK